MKRRELPQGGAEQKPEMLLGKEKFEIVPKLFGSKAARQVFIETCEQYVALRGVSFEGHLEGDISSEPSKYSTPRRADLHNRIMKTLQRLSLQKLDPLSEKVLREMASRETAVQIVKEWVLAHEGEENEDIKTTEEVRKKNNMSGPAYFHSLGRGH